MAHSFEDTNEGVDGTKSLLYAKKWDVYILEKELFLKVGNLVEVDNKDGKKAIWRSLMNMWLRRGLNTRR